MTMLEKFEKLCTRLINCQKWWYSSSEIEHKKYEKNVLELCDQIDRMFLSMNEKEKEIAWEMLKASALPAEEM